MPHVVVKTAVRAILVGPGAFTLLWIASFLSRQRSARRWSALRSEGFLVR